MIALCLLMLGPAAAWPAGAASGALLGAAAGNAAIGAAIGRPVGLLGSYLLGDRFFKNDPGRKCSQRT